MTFKHPFANEDDEHDGPPEYDLSGLEDPDFVREDLGADHFFNGRISTQTSSDTTYIGGLVSLARAFMWDYMPDANEKPNVHSFNDLEMEPRPTASRSNSFSSEISMEIFMDEDDPRITGATPYQSDIDDWREMFRAETGNIPTDEDEQRYFTHQTHGVKRKCLVDLGQAFIRFGAPNHRLEGLMKAANEALQLREVRFVVLPSSMLIAFGDGSTGSSEISLVKGKPVLDIYRLSETYRIYKSLTHGIMGAYTADSELARLLDKDWTPVWSEYMRLAFAFWTAFIVCPMAFGGSLLDAVVAGIFGTGVALCSFRFASGNTVFSTLFEIFAVIVVSFISQALSAFENEKWVCYSAVSTAGVVTLLPGFLILSSSQEIAAKHAMSGSIKMIYALVYACFLGFCLDLGSQFYLVADESERILQTEAMAYLHPDTITGTFTRLGNLTIPWTTGTFTFSNTTGIQIDPKFNHFVTDTCLRVPGSSWYLKEWPVWTVFFLVPIYTVVTAFRHGQPFPSVKAWTWQAKQLVAMIVISGISYAANRWTNRYFAKSDSVTAVGAFACGLAGNIYGRFMGGYAYTAMVPGVLFLVPSGIASVNGESYTGQNITLRILQVSIGVTVGLGFTNWLVYLPKLAHLDPIRLRLPKRWGGLTKVELEIEKDSRKERTRLQEGKAIFAF